MAEKRKIKAQEPPTGNEQAKVKGPELPTEMGWKEWFTTVYARYWYIIICIGVCLLGMIWVKWTLMLGWDVAIFFIFLVVPIEAYGYYMIWMRKGKRKR